MKSKYIIYILICILALTALATVASASTYEVFLDGDYIVEDGDLRESDAYRDNTSNEIKVLTGSNPDTSYRGYVEWDISSIPTSANITEMALIRTQTGGGGTLGDFKSIRECTARPSTSDNTTLLNAISANYYEEESFDGDLNSTTNDWTTSPISSFQENVTAGREWFAFIFKNRKTTNTWVEASFASNESTDQEPSLWIQYEMNAPKVNLTSGTPTDGETGVNLTPKLCINLTHDDGNDMNITWYNWNGSDWVKFASNGTGDDGQTLTNGTYCQNFTNATDLCETYYWSIDAYDEFGNLTQYTYEFDTHCIKPPSNLSYTTGNDWINITWDKYPEHEGTSYTEIYYQHGNYPPNYGGGTSINTTNEYYNFTGLLEGQCYGFNFFTNWNSSEGNWTLSSSSTSKVYCCEGGEYRVLLYDEQTKQPIHLNQYPYNLSTFKINVHYHNNQAEEFFIKGDNATAGANSTLIDCTEETGINISAPSKVWYFELICFYDFNESGLWAGKNSVPKYSRKLTLDAVQNVTTCGYSKNTIKFYIANDTTIYNQNYYYNNGSVNTLTTDTDFVNSLVKYQYNFFDKTNLYLSQDPNDVFVSIYEQKAGQNFIIHQEFIDSSHTVNPVLLYGKDYLIGINNTLNENSIDNIGLAPTDENKQPIVIIDAEYTKADLMSGVNINWTRESHFLNITYTDNNYYTDEVEIRIYKDNKTKVGSLVWWDLEPSNDFTSVFDSADENTSYFVQIRITISKNVNQEKYRIHTYENFTSFRSYTSQITGDDISNTFTPIFGSVPLAGTSWGAMVIVFLMIVITFGLMVVSIPLGFIGGGASGILLTTIIGNLNPILLTASFLLIVLGVIATLFGDKK